MASLFDSDIPVLEYGYKAHDNPGKRNDRYWFCWPAFAYRVIAPVQKKQSMNLIQRTVLGVLRSSNLTAQDIASRLGVHPELVAHVAVELKGKGYIDERWGVTDRGQRALLKAEAAESELEVAWVFQDPWSQDLWPFITPSLQQADVETDPRGRRTLQLGSTGSPWEQRLWSVKPPQTSGRVPTPEEILRASRRHKRFEQRAQRVGYWDDGDLDPASAERTSLDRICAIDTEAEPVFLVSFLYSIEGRKSHEWYACDFFGFGSNPTLRRKFNDAARDFPPLQAELSRWLGTATTYADLGSFQEMLETIQEEADTALVRCMTAQYSNQPEADRLRRVFRALYEVHLSDCTADATRCEMILIECRKTLEFFFRELAKAYPLQGVSNSMSQNDRDFNSTLICQAASDVGLATPPESFQRVTKGQVRSVSEYDDAWRLRPLIVATLLAARQAPNHPLRDVASQTPDLLTTLDDVASVAGSASHVNEQSWAFEDLSKTVNDLTHMICLFRNLPHQNLADVLNG